MSNLDQPVGEHDERLRLGGMALENGLLVYGPTSWAAAVRERGGKIAACSGQMPRFGSAVHELPGVRGVLRMLEAVAVLPVMRRRLPQARLPFENPVVVGTGLVATGLALYVRANRPRTAGSELMLSTLGLVPALLSLKRGEVASYHGVEHKAIAAYEAGDEDPADAAKEHERCGSHLVAPMLLLGVAGDALVRRLLRRPGPIAQTGVALGGMAASLEVFAWCERHPDTLLARLLRRPGFELQRLLGTREPTDEQLDVGRVAIDELLHAERAAAS